MDTGRRSHRPPPPAGGGVAGGREDCWSEGATAALVEAWGDRYLQLSRGNLRQKDWKEVADAVNDRQAIAGRPSKTDAQCKNRIDTIKKKYKAEKAKPGTSSWPFFSRIDFLIGPTAAAAAAAAPSLKKLHPPPLVPHGKQRHPSLTFAVKARNVNENPYLAVYSGGSSSRSRLNSPGSSESSRGEFVGRNGYAEEEGDDDEVDEDEDEKEERKNGFFHAVPAGGKRRRSWAGLGASGSGGGEEGAFGELARAIVRFAEVYERMESLKQKQIMELERQRMEFARDLEFQRMQMFMEAQLELEKMKRPKYASGSGKRSYSGFQAPQ